MAKKKNSPANKEKPKKAAPGKNEHTEEAHTLADKDIEQDPDLNSKPHREDDLDEGELARLEGED